MFFEQSSEEIFFGFDVFENSFDKVVCISIPYSLVCKSKQEIIERLSSDLASKSVPHELVNESFSGWIILSKLHVHSKEFHLADYVHIDISYLQNLQSELKKIEFHREGLRFFCQKAQVTSETEKAIWNFGVGFSFITSRPNELFLDCNSLKLIMELSHQEQFAKIEDFCHSLFDDHQDYQGL